MGRRQANYSRWIKSLREEVQSSVVMRQNYRPQIPTCFSCRSCQQLMAALSAVHCCYPSSCFLSIYLLTYLSLWCNIIIFFMLFPANTDPLCRWPVTNFWTCNSLKEIQKRGVLLLVGFFFKRKVTCQCSFQPKNSDPKINFSYLWSSMRSSLICCDVELKLTWSAPNGRLDRWFWQQPACTSAFDSIILQEVGLFYQMNYLKCLLFHHPEGQQDDIFYLFIHTLNNQHFIHHTAASKKSLSEVWAWCAIINLGYGLRPRSLWDPPATFSLRGLFLTWPLLFNTICTDSNTHQ